MWRQESILGSVFEGSIARHGEWLIPTITGRAYITAEATLLSGSGKTRIAGGFR